MIYTFKNQKEYDKGKAEIVSPVVLYRGKEGDIYTTNDELEKAFITINSDSLINLDIFKKFGGVSEDYFLDRIDDIVKNYFFCFPSHCLYELKSILTDVIKIILFEKNKAKK